MIILGLRTKLVGGAWCNGKGIGDRQKHGPPNQLGLTMIILGLRTRPLRQIRACIRMEGGHNKIHPWHGWVIKAWINFTQELNQQTASHQWLSNRNSLIVEPDLAKPSGKQNAVLWRRRYEQRRGRHTNPQQLRVLNR